VPVSEDESLGGGAASCVEVPDADVEESLDEPVSAVVVVPLADVPLSAGVVVWLDVPLSGAVEDEEVSVALDVSVDELDGGSGAEVGPVLDELDGGRVAYSGGGGPAGSSDDVGASVAVEAAEGSGARTVMATVAARESPPAGRNFAMAAPCFAYVWCRVAGRSLPVAAAAPSPKSSVHSRSSPWMDSVKATSSGAGPRAGEARMESAPCVPTATSPTSLPAGPKRPSPGWEKQPADDAASRTRAAHTAA
jgi:hypothetical protein